MRIINEDLVALRNIAWAAERRSKRPEWKNYAHVVYVLVNMVLTEPENSAEISEILAVKK